MNGRMKKMNHNRPDLYTETQLCVDGSAKADALYRDGWYVTEVLANPNGRPMLRFTRPIVNVDKSIETITERVNSLEVLLDNRIASTPNEITLNEIMKRFIIIQFAFAALIIGTIAAMMYMLHGWKGMAAYLLFAALCLTPAAIKAREILKREKGGEE